MASLLKKPQVVISTKEGECEIHILLDLNINLNANGVSIKVKEEEEQHQDFFAMPDFKMEKIKFGEKVK